MNLEHLKHGFKKEKKKNLITDFWTSATCCRALSVAFLHKDIIYSLGENLIFCFLILIICSFQKLKFYQRKEEILRSQWIWKFSLKHILIMPFIIPATGLRVLNQKPNIA